RKDPEHDQRHHQHGREDRAANAQFPEHDYSVFSLTGAAVWPPLDSPSAPRPAPPLPPPSVTRIPSARLSTSVNAPCSPSLTPSRISIRSPTRSPVFSSCIDRWSPFIVKTR